MDYTKAAEEILELCGGKGNVSSVTHCATRLRLFIINKETVDTAQMKKIKGVLGTVYSGDELQIVLGKNLIPVYQETVRLHGEKIQGEAKIPEESKTAGADGGKRAGRADGPRGIKELGGRLVGFISAAVTPMIPGLVAGGMLPSVDKGAHAPSAVFWRLAALTSIGVRPVRLIPLPCQPPKYGTWGPKEFCASDL